MPNLVGVLAVQSNLMPSATRDAVLAVADQLRSLNKPKPLVDLFVEGGYMKRSNYYKIWYAFFVFLCGNRWF